MSNFKFDMQLINSNFKNINRITFILVLTFLMFLILLVFNLTLNFIEFKDIEWFDSRILKNHSIIYRFLCGVLLVPIIETFLYQFLPYSLLNKVYFFKNRNYLILLISALIFGASHCYSLFYTIYGFFQGIVLMFGYMIRIKSDNKTFYVIALCHSLLNLGIFLFETLK